MKVSEAIAQRMSVRAFQARTPPAATVRAILGAAARAPSGGNLQPWRVYGLAGEPMDILINSYLIAQGEVVVVDDKYGIRITEIITPSERVQKLNR